MTVVLDTCAIVGAVSDPGQLPPRAASLLEADDTADARILDYPHVRTVW